MKDFKAQPELVAKMARVLGAYCQMTGIQTQRDRDHIAERIVALYAIGVTKMTVPALMLSFSIHPNLRTAKRR